MMGPEDILERATGMKAQGLSFALATVVRTVSVTAAKAGAKALINSDGGISGGWIGGGCARAAVLKAASAALTDGQSRLISIQPQDLLANQGITAGEARNGVEFANNMCPSQGTMDIFVEPFLPRACLAILGASPVAVALAELGARMGFQVSVSAPLVDHPKFLDVEQMIDGLTLPPHGRRLEYIVVATQGAGDAAALAAAVAEGPAYLAFVGSHKKAAALKAKLLEAGAPPGTLAALHAPAGIDLGAITPDEIALSVVAEMVAFRRQGQR